MKKILLSTITILSLATAGELNDTTPYTTSDNANAEIEALKAQMASMSAKLNELEKKQAAPQKVSEKPKGVTVKSHAPVLKFSGVHYLGFNRTENGKGEKENRFETRRNYFQVKAYFEENPKSYLRVTMDTYDEKATNPNAGQSSLREKYAYLYLDNILPYTGIELGQTHRPWIDYEEHNAWYYRSISKTLVEARYGADLTNSADRGFDLKTKTPYFSSELGLFDGEGYHNTDTNISNGAGLSAEWRLTTHLLGTGEKHSKKSLTYANLSFFGQRNKNSEKHGAQDLNWMGIHAVYNQPEFLIAAQYIDVQDGVASRKGSGYSINGAYRFTAKWNTLARYDYFDLDDNTGEKERIIMGLAYQYNKNIEFIANYLKEDGSKLSNAQKQDVTMLTASVEW